jgi:hypothetical protein
MKLAFIKLGEPEGSLRHINALLRDLKARGVEVEEIPLDPQNVQKTVDRLSEFQPQFTIDLNGTGVIIGEQEGKKLPLHDLFGFVHMSLFTEDPLLHFPNLLGLSQNRNMVALVTDIKYVDSLRLLGVENVSYITPFLDFGQLPEPPSEREFEITFLGPVINPEIIVNSVRANLPENIFPLFIEAGEYMFRNPEVNVLTAAGYILSLFNPQFQEEFNRWKKENQEAFFRLLNDITIYASMRKRWYIINFLEGINLKIVGEFQGEMREDHEQIKADSHDDLLRIYGNSYLTVMSFPQTVPSGIGFTPLEVSAMGSAGMIDYRGTLPGFLTPGEEIITYMPLDRADIEEKVLYYLDNLQEAVEIGERARKAVIDRYRVDDRSEFVFKMMNDILHQAQKPQESQEKK